MNTEVIGGYGNRVDLSSHHLKKTIPSWIVWIQCICFAVLYAIWSYPLTNFLSDLCMIVGALLSVYILYINRDFFRTKQAMPFWLLVLLLIWVVFHLLFLSNNFPLQLRELTNIWKRVVIAIIFGLGFGMAISSSQSKSRTWLICYVGMLMTALIFLGKYWLDLSATKHGWILPESLKIYHYRNSVFYMYKTDYVVFCLPLLAISLAQLKANFEKKKRVLVGNNLLYLAGILVVLLTFLIINTKNGFAHSFILMTTCFGLIIFRIIKNYPIYLFRTINLKNLLFKFIGIFIVGFLVISIFYSHIKKNEELLFLWSDFKVSVNVDQNNHWKYWGAKGYPYNEHGRMVSNTVYERLSWAIVGIRLVKENPIGYGLVENSFGYIANDKWPDSLLRQSHSGWLDLTLGIGIPGFSFILTALVIAIYQLAKKSVHDPSFNKSVDWSSIGQWILWTLLLIWTTSEISLKNYLINLLFWVSFVVGLSSESQASNAKNLSYK